MEHQAALAKGLMCYACTKSRGEEIEPWMALISFGKTKE